MGPGGGLAVFFEPTEKALESLGVVAASVLRVALPLGAEGLHLGVA